MTLKTVISVLLTSVLFAAGSSSASILQTQHNLSVSGPGTIKASNEDRVCIFCHTPHHATTVEPLWNRDLSTAIYDLYASSTRVSRPGQPTGASRLCLSCHDGTIAVGMLASETVEMVGGITSLPPGGSNLEIDLHDDHPVSLAYTSSLAAQRGEMADPLSLPQEVRLEDGQMLQCTSCHDPHKDPYGMFLVLSQQGSQLCLACHNQTGWSLSSHAGDPAVADQACASCHQPHGAPGAERLLKSTTEEGTCLTHCHNGSGDGADIQTVATRFYNHPADYAAGIHDILENPLTMDKHVECVDCHDPHQANSQEAPLANPPQVNGRLNGVKGVTLGGTVIQSANYEYEICFSCHADNAFSGTSPVTRFIETSNLRLQFDPANPSYHPVAAPGKNLNVPSLRPEYSEADMIYCSDCHGSDSSVRAGGTGADGPHGSIYPHILLARYEQDSYPISYAVTNYELCFRCHDPDALFDPGVTTFSNGMNSSHRTHVRGHGVPCSACHDPHGVAAAQGATAAGNAHLINFDVRFVDPGGTYDAVGRSCTVSCHSGNNGLKSY